MRITYVCVRKCYDQLRLWYPEDERTFEEGEWIPCKKDGSPHFVPIAELHRSPETGQPIAVKDMIEKVRLEDAKADNELRKKRRAVKAKQDARKK